MPCYFFHIRTEHRMISDRTGLDLPDIRGLPASEMAMALWCEALDREFQTGQILVITNERGQVVFVTAV